MNAEGTRILHFALAYNRIANIWFKKPESQLITYFSCRAKTQIDYTMSIKFAVALNVKAIPVCTQHQMVLGDLATDTKTPKPPKPVSRRFTFKLKEPECRAKLQEKLGDLTDTDTWEDLKLKLRIYAEETCFFTGEEKNAVVNERTGSSSESEEGRLEEMDSNPT